MNPTGPRALARIRLAATVALRRRRCDAAYTYFVRAVARAMHTLKRESFESPLHASPTMEEIRLSICKGYARLRRRIPRLRCK